ncbi:MAG: DUF952 domain-containing protein [Chloroflexi bacterium]|nr:DUF952 domain-containing protein [Chloroflexota bacterium]
METIYHITTQTSWDTAVTAGQYHADSLTAEGFIHCSTLSQILIPANALYRGQTDLILLCIASSRVHPPIIYEDCYESGQTFPHIYGPLNLDAVTNIIPFPPNADGTFSLPIPLKGLPSAIVSPSGRIREDVDEQ